MECCGCFQSCTRSQKYKSKNKDQSGQLPPQARVTIRNPKILKRENKDGVFNQINGQQIPPDLDQHPEQFWLSGNQQRQETNQLKRITQTQLLEQSGGAVGVDQVYVSPKKQSQITLTSMQNNAYPSKYESQMLVNQSQNPSYKVQSMPASDIDHLFYGLSIGTKSVIPQSKIDQQSSSAGICESGISMKGRKSGNIIYACKTIKYLCGSCGKSFKKLILLDINLRIEKEFAICQAYDLFNLSENNETVCPYCAETVCLVLDNYLMVGDADQMEKFDLTNNYESQHATHHHFPMSADLQNPIAALTEDSQKEDDKKEPQVTPIMKKIAGSQREKHELSIDESNRQGFRLKQGFNANPNVPIGNGDVIEVSDNMSRQSLKTSAREKKSALKRIAPIQVVIQHKLQKLRDPKKYAQMLIVGEPLKQLTVNRLNLNTVMTKATDTVQGGDDHSTTLHHHVFNNESQCQQAYLTPDHYQIVDKVQCLQYNQDIMRTLINKKMKKNKTFAEIRNITPQQYSTNVRPLHQQMTFGAREGNLQFQQHMPKKD